MQQKAGRRMIVIKDGVDITRLVQLHRKYHGMPVSCAIRRYREKTAQRQERSLAEADEQHGRGAEPSGHPDQRGWILVQA